MGCCNTKPEEHLEMEIEEDDKKIVTEKKEEKKDDAKLNELEDEEIVEVAIEKKDKKEDEVALVEVEEATKMDKVNANEKPLAKPGEIIEVFRAKYVEKGRTESKPFVPSRFIRHPPLDLSKVYNSMSLTQDLTTLDDGTGKLKAWVVKDLNRSELAESLFGQFYSGDSYIYLYSYKGPAGQDLYILYYWQGTESSQDEVIGSALIAKAIDDSLQGRAVEVRVVPTLEPAHFLALFQGKMIVHKGGYGSHFESLNQSDSLVKSTDAALYRIRGDTPLTTRAYQTGLNAKEMNSTDTFILHDAAEGEYKGKQFVWFGAQSNTTEKELAKTIADRMIGERERVEFEQGAETAEFWETVEGSSNDIDKTSVENKSQEPKLFRIAKPEGDEDELTIEQVSEYSRSALKEGTDAKRTMLLDTGFEVYIWVPEDTDIAESRGFVQDALAYLEPMERNTNTPIIRVFEGIEPPLFTRFFSDW